MRQTKNILVTGASGFVGKHCLPILKSRGYDITATTRKNGVSSEDIEWRKIDLLNRSEVSTLLSNNQFTHLLNLAWYPTEKDFWTTEYNLDWIQSSLHLTRLFFERGGKNLVQTGTCAEYSDYEELCVENETETNASTLYGTSKNALSRIYQSFAEQYDTSISWARLFFIYGPEENPGRLVSSVIENLIKDRPVLCSHGRQIRDYTYIKDVATALVLLLENECRGNFNIATGNGETIRDIVLQLANQFNKAESVQFGAIPAGPLDPKQIIGSPNKLYEATGYKLDTNLEFGLKETIKYWKSVYG